MTNKGLPSVLNSGTIKLFCIFCNFNFSSTKKFTLTVKMRLFKSYFQLLCMQSAKLVFDTDINVYSEK